MGYPRVKPYNMAYTHIFIIDPLLSRVDSLPDAPPNRLSKAGGEDDGQRGVRKLHCLNRDGRHVLPSAHRARNVVRLCQSVRVHQIENRIWHLDLQTAPRNWGSKDEDNRGSNKGLRNTEDMDTPVDKAAGPERRVEGTAAEVAPRTRHSHQGS